MGDDEWGDDWIREDDEWADPRAADEPLLDDADPDATALGPRTAIVDDPDGLDDEDERYRRRRGLAVAGAGALVLLLGIALAALLVRSGGDDSSALETDRSSTTSTSRVPATIGRLPGGPSTSTSTAAVADGGVVDGPAGSSSTSTTRAGAKPPAGTTSTTADTPDEPGCAPGVTGTASEGNKPARITFCVDDPTPKVGQQVKVYGSAVDPDAEVQVDCIKVSWDGEPFSSCTPRSSPPSTAPTNVNESFSFQHAYASPGPHTIRVIVVSDPATPSKSSTAQTAFQVTVHA